MDRSSCRISISCRHWRKKSLSRITIRRGFYLEGRGLKGCVRSTEEGRSEYMDAQAQYMYQRNPNEQRPNSPQRPNSGNNGNGNNGGPPRSSGTALLVRSLIIIGVVLLGWYLFQYFFSQNSSSISQNVIEVPYITFYQQVQVGNDKTITFQGPDATGEFYRYVT